MYDSFCIVCSYLGFYYLENLRISNQPSLKEMAQTTHHIISMPYLCTRCNADNQQSVHLLLGHVSSINHPYNSSFSIHPSISSDCHKTGQPAHPSIALIAESQLQNYFRLLGVCVGKTEI